METKFVYMDILKAIADDTRMAILQCLKSGPKTVTEIENLTGKSHSTTSQQLKRMVISSLVIFRQEGTQKFYQVRDLQIFDLLESITSYLSTSEVISNNKLVRGKKVILMGLDKSGKTSILLSFLGKKNLISFMDSNLKATRGNRHMREVVSDLNLEMPEKEPESSYSEYGGQIVYRKEFIKVPLKILKPFEKIIYVIDIQDEKRYVESLEYLKHIVDAAKDISLAFEMDIFLHKFDPDIELNENYSQEKLNEKLISKIKQIIPVGFKNTIYKTTIYTVFRKSLMMQTYHAL